MRVSLIAALSQNYVIGVAGKLPWHISEDLKRFKAITQGHPVIMGRKTYESIGRILPNRENLIITRQENYELPPGGRAFSSLPAALADCEGVFEDVFVIGGGEIYTLALRSLKAGDRLYLTRVHAEIEGDAFFPRWREDQFHEIAHEDRPAGASYPAYSFVILEKVIL